MRRVRWGRPDFLLVLAVAAALVLGLAGCSTQPTATPGPIPSPTVPPGWRELAFETIEKDDWSDRPYREPEARLLVLTGFREIPGVSAKALEALRALDYRRHLGLAVLQGSKANLDYGVTIDRIAYLGSTVNIYSTFVSPIPGREVHPSVSSWYHLVKVERPRQIVGMTVRFVLVANGEEIIKQDYYIPDIPPSQPPPTSRPTSTPPPPRPTVFVPPTAEVKGTVRVPSTYEARPSTPSPSVVPR